MNLENVLVENLYKKLKALKNSKQFLNKKFTIIKNAEEIFSIKKETALDYANYFSINTKLSNKRLNIFKLENLDKQILLEVLSSYDTKSVYGVLVKHKDNVFNPMHLYKIDDFVNYLKNVEKDDKKFVVYSYVYDKSENQDFYDKSYLEYKQESLNEYISKLMNEYSKFKQTEILENCYIEYLLDGTDIKSFDNNTLYNISREHILGINSHWLYERSKRIPDGAYSASYIQPVSLCSDIYSMTLPYYGLLCLKNRGEDICYNFYNDCSSDQTSTYIIGLNLSSNFKSGSLGHLKFYQFYDIGNDEYISDSEIRIYIEEILKEKNLPKYKVNEITLSDISNYIGSDIELYDDYDESHCKSLNSDSDFIYTNNICLGDRSNDIHNIDVLDNMNISSMYYYDVLGEDYYSESQAHQILSKSIYKKLYKVLF